MRLFVTGATGQVVTALSELADAGLEVVTSGRPVCDLERPDTVRDAIRAARPDVVVSAAAWTAVDLAESEPDRVFSVNATGAGVVAEAAADVGAPVIHLSTDYVFDGELARAYVEADATGPIGVYGASKLAGEKAVAATSRDHLILRTAWVHAPYGKNFLRTMLRLAETREVVGVVADQFGTPSYAPDIAAGIVAVARNLRREPANDALRGIFHLSGSGPTASWADFADAIFEGLAARGGPRMTVNRLTTAQYPTPTRRPVNSRLDCSKLATQHAFVVPDWRDGVERSLDRLIGERLGNTARFGN